MRHDGHSAAWLGTKLCGRQEATLKGRPVHKGIKGKCIKTLAMDSSATNYCYVSPPPTAWCCAQLKQCQRTSILHFREQPKKEQGQGAGAGAAGRELGTKATCNCRCRWLYLIEVNYTAGEQTQTPHRLRRLTSWQPH